MSFHQRELEDGLGASDGATQGLILHMIYDEWSPKASILYNCS